jgi:mRNA interferase HigB
LLALVAFLATVDAAGMRIITVKRLREYARRHPTIASTLDHWTELIGEGEFGNLVELRRALPTADQVTVKSGRTVTIFNLTNHYRLITAVHYNHQIVFILLLLTHNEYDQGLWKKKL